jgi:hypothetical protein
MSDKKKSQAPLFRAPVRTLAADELARVAGGWSSAPGLKPSQTPIDVQGFR